MNYYVDATVTQSGDGSIGAPFQKINEAAQIAKPGDEVLVYPGIYREAVDPIYAGTEDARIVYRSVEKLGAVITGAESVKSWVHEEGNVWKVSIHNDWFGNYNPFQTLISGDWYIATIIAHTGDVFLNGKSMYETIDLENVYDPKVSKASWDPEFSVYTWYTTQDEASDETIIYANFQGMDPNEENVEISVRETCFHPSEEGVDYITLSGFSINKAATQWAPPTAYQIGMVGPHWSKGWIIEDCEIAESKCSGISLGKYKQKGNDNKWLHEKYKDGTQTERDCICQAQREGWTKERIGHHIVRRCDIHDCGQTGIVGHLGGVFSVIEENHIHHINNKQNLAGAEIGGIKMHAAIDVVIRNNKIHDCTRGIWLDWQAQGTRVTQNLFYNNTLPKLKGEMKPCLELFQALGEDIFVEVSHGPTLIDNNILLSTRALKLAAQGIAVVHNLIGGSIAAVGIGTNNGAKTMESVRYTPYHVQHRTEIAGFMSILHGDTRFYNNVFVQQEVKPTLRMLEDLMSHDGNDWDDGCASVGTMRYDGFPTFEEWDKEFEGYCGMGSAPSDRYYMHLPVWSEGNVYFNGAKAWEKETNFVEDNENHVELKLSEKEGEWILETNLYDFLPVNTGRMINTEILGKAFEPEQYFENPDETPITFDHDYFGCERLEQTTAGPFYTEKRLTSRVDTSIFTL